MSTRHFTLDILFLKGWRDEYRFSHFMASMVQSLRVWALRSTVGFVYLFIYCFLGLHLRHMEVPRLGIELELQLPAYITTTAIQGPNHVFDLYTTAQGNAGSRPGIQLASSWILVRFISAEPQRELLQTIFKWMKVATSNTLFINIDIWMWYNFHLRKAFWFFFYHLKV